MKSIYKNIVNDPAVRHIISEKELQDIHSCLIEMLREIVSVCDKEGITPFLIYGNLLGKIRHNGFIPWDDDLDIGMLRADYDRFAILFKKEMSSKYYISTPNCNGRAYYRFIQVGRKGTFRFSQGENSLIDDDSPVSHCFIDIFPFDYAPDNIILRKMKSIWCTFLMMIAGCVDFKIENITTKEIDLFKSTTSGRVEFFIRKVFHRLFSFKSPSDWYHVVDHSVRWKKSRHLVCAFGKDYYEGSVYNINEILPLRESEYYGISISIPNDCDAYLRKNYGDYMELPPVEKRQCHAVEKIVIKDGIFK